MLTIVTVSRPTSPERARILDMRVSELLACHTEILPLLVAHGFTPLNNPVMRRALAPTVTLAQALRLHPLSPERERGLLTMLEALCHWNDNTPSADTEDERAAPH